MFPVSISRFLSHATPNHTECTEWKGLRRCAYHFPTWYMPEVSENFAYRKRSLVMHMHCTQYYVVYQHLRRHSRRSLRFETQIRSNLSV